MSIRRWSRLVLLLIVPGMLCVLATKKASAVPSFARQTGMACTACHTMFPELTPFGRTFKLTGYVLNKTGAKHPSELPLAGMVQASYTRTDNKSVNSLQENTWAFHNMSPENDVLNTPQDISIFYGGQIYGKVGALVQATWSNDGGNLPGMDMADIRYANTIPICGKNFVYGLTFNNNPSSEDVWNSTPAWGFPYASSNIEPTPAADPVIDNSLSALVGGGGVYGYWDDTLYAAVSVYRSALNGPFSFFSAGDHPLGTYVQGAIPYWRIALTRHYGPHWFELGTYGMSVNEFANGYDGGPTNNYLDTAIDGEYQYINGNTIYSLEGTWIHEDQDLAGNQGSSNPSDHINTFRINGNGYYRTLHCGEIGGTVSYFSTTGSNDPLVYTSNPAGSPNSDGEILELDYMPAWHNYGPDGCGFAKFSLQYVMYNRFDGVSSGASDNNTLYLLAWFMF
ncbi:MAG: cytochrome C [Syntrophobacteraceae bacterium]